MSETRGHTKVDRLHAQLRDGVAELASSNDWQRWLAVAAKFHRYSFRNVMLILIQRPEATLVAGYRRWQQLGRQVRRGEHGIAILAPCTRTVTDPDTGEDTRRVVGFRPTTVFDIAQTDGEALPTAPTDTIDSLGGEGPEGLWDALAVQALERGFPVFTGDADRIGDPRANGVCRRQPSPEIVVADDLAPAMQCKTLAHELAHARLHDGDVDRARAEVEAESVAYIVCTAAGMDTADYSFGYVTGWSNGDPDVVEATGHRVMHTAQAVLDGLTDHHTPMPAS